MPFRLMYNISVKSQTGSRPIEILLKPEVLIFDIWDLHKWILRPQKRYISAFLLSS